MVSFEVEPIVHSHMKLVVFNCPELGISTPMVNVYSSATFRPEDVHKMLGNLTASYMSTESSCNHLIIYTVGFYWETSRSYFNLEFRPVNGSNISHVFLGEVTFLMEFEGDVLHAVLSNTALQNIAWEFT